MKSATPILVRVRHILAVSCFSYILTGGILLRLRGGGGGGGGGLLDRLYRRAGLRQQWLQGEQGRSIYRSGAPRRGCPPTFHVL